VLGAEPAIRLRALVVDDEAPAREELVWLLGLDSRVGRVCSVSNGADALRALEGSTFDVAFCDVRMPGLDGLDLARVFARFADRPHVVFVTAYERHALAAFDLRAVDYLLKPVRPDRLAEAVRRVAEAVRQAADAPGGHEPPPAADDETIAVELAGVTRFLHRSQVRYVVAQGDYVRLHTDTDSHLVRTSLATLEERWADAGFVRIHRSTLVALDAVGEVHMTDGRCSVRLGDCELPVSRRHTRALRDRLVRAARLSPRPRDTPPPAPPQGAAPPE
jgi:DNA-binding LytR/AlgR family response regulator